MRWITEVVNDMPPEDGLANIIRNHHKKLGTGRLCGLWGPRGGVRSGQDNVQDWTYGGGVYKSRPKIEFAPVTIQLALERRIQHHRHRLCFVPLRHLSEKSSAAHSSPASFLRLCRCYNQPWTADKAQSGPGSSSRGLGS
jgi:hypothetical protein